jgi:2-dehydro-3-deoxygalactonokinase
MRWSEGFIAVDWGTTNRRGYALDASGRLIAETEDDKGILSVPKECFPEAVAELRAALGNKPLLMGGMIGSNRGWREAPYVPAPAGLRDLAGHLQWIEGENAAIVPGVSWEEGESADVMRGEEMQILGAAAAGLIPQDAVVCHPGTHNKWIRLEGGRIIRFKTVMTGELFNLLREHSILADLLWEPAAPNAAFARGVERGLAEDCLTADLFSVRARVLLGKMPRQDAASYTSGLVIGTDVRTGLKSMAAEEVVVMGRPELTSLFAAALDVAGRKSRVIDGEEAFLAGAKHLVEALS